VVCGQHHAPAALPPGKNLLTTAATTTTTTNNNNNIWHNHNPTVARILWCTKVHHHAHNSLALVPILSYITPNTHPIYVFCEQTRRNVCELSSCKHSPGINITFHYFHTAQPPVCQGLIIETSRSYSDTPQSIRLLWTSDQPVAETSSLQHSQQANIHALHGNRTRSPNKRAAETHVSYRAATAVGQ
jgi:hypothetical protein